MIIGQRHKWAIIVNLVIVFNFPIAFTKFKRRGKKINDILIVQKDDILAIKRLECQKLIITF